MKRWEWRTIWNVNFLLQLNLKIFRGNKHQSSLTILTLNNTCKLLKKQENSQGKSLNYANIKS